MLRLCSARPRGLLVLVVAGLVALLVTLVVALVALLIFLVTLLVRLIRRFVRVFGLVHEFVPGGLEEPFALLRVTSRCGIGARGFTAASLDVLLFCRLSQ